MENARVLAKIKIVPIFAPAFAKIVKWYNSGFVNRNSGFDSRSWLTKHQPAGMIFRPVFLSAVPTAAFLTEKFQNPGKDLLNIILLPDLRPDL